MTDVTCAVPGCTNMLTEEQRSEKIALCSECEAENIHICDSCGKRMDAERIENGASICRECEVNPSDLKESLHAYEDESMLESNVRRQGKLYLGKIWDRKLHGRNSLF